MTIKEVHLDKHWLRITALLAYADKKRQEAEEKRQEAEEKRQEAEKKRQEAEEKKQEYIGHMKTYKKEIRVVKKRLEKACLSKSIDWVNLTLGDLGG